MQQKIVYAGVASSSFAKGSELLAVLADLPVPTKAVERLTQTIGAERVARRNAATAAFTALPLAAKFTSDAGIEPPEVAALFADGGRMQIRDRAGRTDATASSPDEGFRAEEPFEEQTPPTNGFWREDKVGLLAWMKSRSHAVDPCPEIPQGFLDVLRIPMLARQLGKVAAQQHEDSEAERTPTEAVEAVPTYEPPEVEHRRVVATCRPWRDFAPHLAAAARAAGFQTAKRKAFVADGAANNWRLHKRFFASFTAVLDFIHALSYVYAGATAGRSEPEGWDTYRRWISRVWQGQVSEVIDELQKRQEEVGAPQEGESETSVPSVVTRVLGYLENQQDKMKYAEYRRQGLPITSSVAESAVKQMNQRVKGSEKFWGPQGAEAIVQLRADYLSDDAPLEEFWRHRQATASGQHRHRRAA